MNNKQIQIPQIETFEDLDKYINFARSTFRLQGKEKIEEVADVFNLYIEFIKSIGKFKSPEEWKDSQQEYIIKLHFRALEYLLGFFYLSESGLYENALALKRNIIEIIILSIAIGYDEEAFVKWKNRHKDFRDFYKILSYVKEIEDLPQQEKELLSYLKNQYADSCDYSHALNMDTFSKQPLEGKVHLGPKIITKDYQDKRLNTIRNLCLNFLSLLIGIFDYSTVVEKEKDKFPEAIALIKKANRYFLEIKKMNEPTI